MLQFFELQYSPAQCAMALQAFHGSPPLAQVQADFRGVRMQDFSTGVRTVGRWCFVTLIHFIVYCAHDIFTC